MLEKRTADRLQEVLRRLGRSLLFYICESYPWASAGEGPALAELQKIDEEERAAVARLAKFLQRQRVPVLLAGSYPSSFTTMNFVSLDYLLPILVKHERETVAAVERTQLEIADAEAAPEMVRIVDMVRNHLQRLEKLAAEHPVAAAG